MCKSTPNKFLINFDEPLNNNVHILLLLFKTKINK